MTWSLLYSVIPRLNQCALNTFTRYLSLIHDKSFIGGEWVSGENGKTFNVYNPVNGKVISSVADLEVEDAELVVCEANNAFPTWGKMLAIERSKILRNFAYLLAEKSKEVAEIITLENGKPFLESMTEVQACRLQLEWFAEQGRRTNGEIYNSSIKGRVIMSIKQPIGVVALIAPWNFPLAMVIRKLSSALAAGCTCIVQPSPETPLSALAAVDIANQSGVPSGVFNVITCQNPAVTGKYFCESPKIAGISFTGSTQVGRILYGQCASTIKRITLELGGNAPFIVFPTADIDKAVDAGFKSRFRNCGQTCICANRFFLHENIQDEFVCKMIDKIKLIKLGNGMTKGVTMGPMVNRSHVERVTKLVADAVNKGAKIEVGGETAKDLGECFYKPTLLVNVTPEMTIYNEEIFGPIVNCITFESEDEVIKLGNNTNVGLAGYFYSNDLSQIFRVVNSLECGMIGVNNTMISTIESPFGGVKESGIGRECSHHGIDEFVNIKAISFGPFKM